jgi:hypothetical protein
VKIPGLLWHTKATTAIENVSEQTENPYPWLPNDHAVAIRWQRYQFAWVLRPENNKYAMSNNHNNAPTAYLICFGMSAVGDQNPSTAAAARNNNAAPLINITAE